MQAAREVLEHGGVTDPEPFTDEMHAATIGFNGKNLPEPDIAHLVPQLRRLFEKPMADLQALINEHWPELDFQGIPDEL